MKKTKLSLVLSLAGGMLFTACSDSAKTSTETKSAVTVEKADANAAPEVNESKEAVVLWTALSMRKTPESKGKYLTTVYQGEKLTFLGETKTDESSERKEEYAKVKLSDGETGWVLDRFIATEAISAAATSELTIFRRPDLLTQTDKKMDKRTFLVILDEQDDWVKIKGVASGDDWFSEGWTLKKNLTTDMYDVSFAVLANKAEEEDNEAKQNEMFDQLLNTEAFKSSVFYEELEQALNPPAEEMTETDELSEEETEVEEIPTETDSTVTEEQAAATETSEDEE